MARKNESVQSFETFEYLKICSEMLQFGWKENIYAILILLFGQDSSFLNIIFFQVCTGIECNLKFD